MSLTCRVLPPPSTCYHCYPQIAAKQESLERIGLLHMTYKTLKRRRSFSPGPVSSTSGEPSHFLTPDVSFDPPPGPAVKRIRRKSSACAPPFVYEQEPSIRRDSLRHSDTTPTPLTLPLSLPLTSDNLQRLQEIDYPGTQGMKKSTADS